MAGMSLIVAGLICIRHLYQVAYWLAGTLSGARLTQRVQVFKRRAFD
jgi:hypothetical protein